MTNIPNHYTDEEVKQVVKKLWKEWKEPESPKIESPQPVEKEKIVSYTADIKTYAIAILLVILTAFIAGWLMRDHGLQDGIESINENKKSNIVSQRIIDRETINITKRNEENDKTREKLQKVYQVTVR